MTKVNKEEIDKCPKTYIKWLYVVLGMAFTFLVYLIYSNIAGSNAYFNENLDSQEAQAFVQTSIIQTSKDETPLVPSAFLGVELIPVDSVIAEQLNIGSKNGVFINRVIPNSPAQEAGLKRGDVIVALDNRTIKDLDRFREIMVRLNPGDKVRLIYIRNGKKDSTYARLTEAPALQKTAQNPGSSDSDTSTSLSISPEQGRRADWGVSLSPLSSTLRESFNIPPDINGIMILSVAPGGAADKAGLMPADLITGIDKTPVSDMDEFFRVILSDKNDTALLDVYSQGKMRYVPIDSSSINIADQTQTRDTTTLRQRIFSLFTGGMPFADEDEEEGGGYQGQPSPIPPKGSYDPRAATAGGNIENLILTEHINEEGDYEKPVCKRLEESGERYNQQEIVIDGEI